MIFSLLVSSLVMIAKVTLPSVVVGEGVAVIVVSSLFVNARIDPDATSRSGKWGKRKYRRIFHVGNKTCQSTASLRIFYGSMQYNYYCPIPLAKSH